MRRVVADRALRALEPPVRVTGPIVIDLTDVPRPAVDDDFVVDWQISDPRPRGIDDESAIPSPA
jgi:hypothetical protein